MSIRHYLGLHNTYIAHGNSVVQLHPFMQDTLAQVELAKAAYAPKYKEYIGRAESIHPIQCTQISAGRTADKDCGFANFTQ